MPPVVLVLFCIIHGYYGYFTVHRKIKIENIFVPKAKKHLNGGAK